MESDLELFSRFGKIHILLPVSAALFLPLDQIAKILIFHLISSDNNNFLFFFFTFSTASFKQDVFSGKS